MDRLPLWRRRPRALGAAVREVFLSPWADRVDASSREVLARLMAVQSAGKEREASGARESDEIRPISTARAFIVEPPNGSEGQLLSHS